MAGINTPKVVTGGLIAGLVFNIGDFLINGVLMATEYAASMTRLGLDPATLQAPSVAATWIVVDFLMGILVVWTYAAIRPRFGPGVRTAILAAVPAFTAVTLVLLGFTNMGFFTMPLFVKGTVYSILNLVIGAVVGAWVYKE